MKASKIMPLAYDKRRGVENRKGEPNEPAPSGQFGKTNREEKRAREALSGFNIPLKQWATRLEVTERIVQMWAAGTKDIPPLRIKQIKAVSLEILWDQRKAIDDYIGQALKDVYGTTHQGRNDEAS